MAYLFELAADCGCDPGKASEFGKEFDGMAWTLSDGTSVGCSFKSSDIWQASDHAWWCRVVPDGVSATGAQPRTVSTTPMIIEVARLLYSHLMRCTGFRFARVGWEVEESLDSRDWLTAKADPSTLPPGIVVSREHFLELGSPSVLSPFGTNAFWKPLQEGDYSKLAQLF